MALLLRTLTLKSKLGFGYSEYKFLTIAELLNMYKHHMLVKCYYELSMINYNDELIDLLCIEKISKPGKLSKEIAKIKVQNSMNKLAEKRSLEELAHELRIKKDSHSANIVKSHYINGNCKSELKRKNRKYVN